MTTSERPSTAQEFALTELRRLILTRQLLPGEPIRQDALAERLGVSRVPVREALKQLEGEGQITYRPRRGYTVTDLSLDDLREVYEIRRIMEDAAARMAMGKVTAAEIATMTAIQREIEAASTSGDLIEMAQCNRRFHFVFLEAADRPRLTRMIKNLWDSTDAYRSLYYSSPKVRSQVNREHRLIMKAIRAGDVEKVVVLLDDHRQHTVDALAAAHPR